MFSSSLHDPTHCLCLLLCFWCHSLRRYFCACRHTRSQKHRLCVWVDSGRVTYILFHVCMYFCLYSPSVEQKKKKTTNPSLVHPVLVFKMCWSCFLHHKKYKMHIHPPLLYFFPLQILIEGGNGEWVDPTSTRWERTQIFFPIKKHSSTIVW